MQKNEVILEAFDYSQDHFKQIDFSSIDKLNALKNPSTTSWINVDGLEDKELLRCIYELFELHPLLLEEIQDVSQRPNFEEFDDYIFITVKMLSCDPTTDKILTEHLSIVVGKYYLITFQEGLAGDVFNPIRERLSRAKSKLRMNGTDYLTYAILDVIIDNYIMIIERFGERIELLERKFRRNQTDNILDDIYEYKMEINFLRKTIRPVRELAVLLEKSESEIIDDKTVPYLKSLVDHMAHATEAIETYQIMLNDQLYIYQTRISNKLNDILRVLTVFSVVFIPLTFIAGVYGTNFDYLPELHFKYSYGIFWGILITTATSMLYYFKRKGWL